ncbi:hypothetical protein NDU88_002787 [Pleurodeles waltl]|uniref:Uncharacterized protein n=1 Tax=Pleurodeles waltl TaxID=8319 RepID=A0AAV7UWM5_PLEWA|nr:hypothetical protein NDU88_002787 [Pleurodeles waltl]
MGDGRTTGAADGLRLAEDSRDRRSLQGGPAQVRRSQRAPAVCTVVRAHGGTQTTSVLLPCINDEVGGAPSLYFSGGCTRLLLTSKMALRPLGPAPASRASGRPEKYSVRPAWPRRFSPPGRQQSQGRKAAAPN